MEDETNVNSRSLEEIDAELNQLELEVGDQGPSTDVPVESDTQQPSTEGEPPYSRPGGD